MFTKRYTLRIRQLTGRIVAQTLGRTGLTATELTVTAFVLTLAAVWLLATGQFVAAGLLIAFASTFDMLDGALARAKNQVSKFGGFLDSTLDRFSDVFIFLGLLIWFQRTAPQSAESLLIFTAMTGSLLTSYIRARAESAGYECSVGLLERPERILLIVLGLLSGLVTPALWLLAILTNLTAVQRFVHVWLQSRSEEIGKRPVGAAESGD